MSDTGSISSRPPVGASVTGVTDETITLGYILSDLQEACTAVGVVAGADVECEDVKQDEMWEAVAAEISDGGGMAGRRVELVSAPVDAARYTTKSGREQEQQRACATWTEDHDVFAVGGRAMSERLLLKCALDNNMAIAPWGYQFQVTEAEFHQPAAPGKASVRDVWYSPHGMLTDRRHRAVAQQLVDVGFFGADAKVGLMIEDDPGIRAGMQVTEQTLEANGVEVVSRAVYPDIINSPWETYVLQFRSAGVTDVVMSATMGDLWSTYFMMRAAENQGWRPGWGIGNDNGPVGLAALGAPREQMANTMGLSWQPAWAISREEPPETNPARRRCSAIEEEHGFPEGYASGLGVCSTLFWYDDVLDRVNEVSPRGMHDVMAQLGDQHVSIDAIDGYVRYGPDKHDGVSLGFGFGFDERCADDGIRCWRPLEAPHPIE